jgi:hypothetical protein
MVQVSPRRATTNTGHKQPELGMLPWMPRTEGKKLSHCQVGELLNGRNGQLLATTDIERMKETLSAAGFKKVAGVVGQEGTDVVVDQVLNRRVRHMTRSSDRGCRLHCDVPSGNMGLRPHGYFLSPRTESSASLVTFVLYQRPNSSSDTAWP